MPRKSSPSAKISYFNKDKVSRALESYVARLAKRHREVEKVLVFGSFARGECVPGSDIDLLLILQESNAPILDRIPKYMPDSFPVGVDVFPYTKHEITDMVRRGNAFITKALQEGVVIFDRSQRRNPRTPTPNLNM